MCATFHAPSLCVICLHLPPVAHGQGFCQSWHPISMPSRIIASGFLPWRYRDCGCIPAHGSGRAPCTHSQLRARQTQLGGHSMHAFGFSVLPTPASGAAPAVIAAMLQLLVKGFPCILGTHALFCPAVASSFANSLGFDCSCVGVLGILSGSPAFISDCCAGLANVCVSACLASAGSGWAFLCVVFARPRPPILPRMRSEL